MILSDVLRLFVSLCVWFPIICAELPDLSFFNPRFQDGIELTCRDVNPKLKGKELEYCRFVNSGTARAYFKDSFTVYNPGAPLPIQQQILYAKYNSVLLIGNSSIDKICSTYVQYFSCNSIFPQCVAESYDQMTVNSPAYYQPCKLQCELVNRYCSFSIDCTQYHDQDCSIVVPSDVYVLQGDWSDYAQLPVMYLCLLIIWGLYSLWWLNDPTVMDDSLRLCNICRQIPTAKTFILIFCVAFWYTCKDWLVCSFWIFVAVSNFQLMYSTLLMLVFCLIANGYAILQPMMPEYDRRTLLFLCCVFYLGNSILLVSKSTISAQSFLICTIAFYGSLYLYIVLHTMNTVRIFHEEVVRLCASLTNVVTPIAEAIPGAEEAGAQNHTAPTANDDHGPEVPVQFQNICGLTPFHPYYKPLLRTLRYLYRWFAILFYRSENLHQLLHPEEAGNLKHAMMFQFYLRRDMYVGFLVLITVNIITEFLAYAIEHPAGDITFTSAVMVYEIGQVITVIYILQIFRPNVVSPFFYTMPVKYFTNYRRGLTLHSFFDGHTPLTDGLHWQAVNSAEQAQSVEHPTGTLEVVDNDTSDIDDVQSTVELIPLLRTNNSVNAAGGAATGHTSDATNTARIGDVEMGNRNPTGAVGSRVAATAPLVLTEDALSNNIVRAGAGTAVRLMVIRLPNKDVFVGTTDKCS